MQKAYFDKLQAKKALLTYSQEFSLKNRKKKTKEELSSIKRRYVIYARKSTENEERQVESVEDQVDKCTMYAKKHNLDVVDILREEKSAKTSGIRKDAFLPMLERLYKGDSYNAILAWHPDRLARNMKEAGEILDMLDKDIILDLKFPSYEFNNDAAGKMTLSILFAMAKEFSDKLSVDTIRGLQRRVKKGLYVGVKKRGYRVIEKSGKYKPDKNTFDLYKKAWDLYEEGKTLEDIQGFLQENEEEISVNSLSNYFKDPFSAGIYVFGSQIVDMSKVEPSFEPIINPERYMTIQLHKRRTTRGWSKSTGFYPFRELAICGRCGSYMTPGVSSGKGGRYLNLACGNKKCNSKSREEEKKPINNSFRSKLIIELLRDLVDNALSKDAEDGLYEEVKQKYLESTSNLVDETVNAIKVCKQKITKNETKAEKTSDALIESRSDPLVSKQLTIKYNSILKEIQQLKKQLETLEQTKIDYDLSIDTYFPDYSQFLNFFKNVGTALEYTDNVHLIDELAKMIFLNITVEDKKVVGTTLNEPFNTLEALKFLNGVANGT